MFFVSLMLKPYHTRTASSNLFKKLQIAEVRALQSHATVLKRCEDAVQWPRTPCGGIHLNLLKINAEAWCLHSVLDSALWARCGNAVWSSRERWARCERAVCMLYRRLVNTVI